MKKITALLGLVGVVCLNSACSTDTGANALDEDLNQVSAVNSSATAVPSSSSTKVVLDEIPTGNSSSAATAGSSSSTVNGDQTPASSSSKVVIHQQVTITDGNGSVDHPNYSSGTFCWTEKCKTENYSAAAPASSSSSFVINVEMSSETPILPMVTETQMIDMRDNKTYTLQTIAGLRWMSQNLNYEIAEGSYCGAGDKTNACDTYGRFYALSAAKKACPTGWRLPTLEEIQAVDATVPEEWWTLGGRVKFSGNTATEYGLDKQQGYWWIASGTSWRVQPDSDEHVEQSANAAEGRAYSVRCVMGE